ncbi:leucine-rich repeat domain-containing protein [Megasphaera sp.]|uniref:leucine-rich repeat domain-containing protein n=1 Tax=Megasphaera sp. TaxID=2023260 RepID=UPI0040252FD1
MSKVLVTESYLTDIGDAIRNKNGSADKYKPSEMAGAISDLTAQDNTVLNSILDHSISGDYVNDDLTEIGRYAFYGCEQLTSATFTKVTKVGTSAFGDCRSLESISLPEVKEINSDAFDACALKSISMPKVEKLGADNDLWGIFDYCPITTINIPSTIKSIGKNTFERTSKLTTITIDRKADAISGSPWGATAATVNWTGTT